MLRRERFFKWPMSGSQNLLRVTKRWRSAHGPVQFGLQF